MVMRLLFLLPQTFRRGGQTDRNGMLMLNNSGKKSFDSSLWCPKTDCGPQSQTEATYNVHHRQLSDYQQRDSHEIEASAQFQGCGKLAKLRDG